MRWLRGQRNTACLNKVTMKRGVGVSSRKCNPPLEGGKFGLTEQGFLENNTIKDVVLLQFLRRMSKKIFSGRRSKKGDLFEN